jgi:hypothetical protein
MFDVSKYQKYYFEKYHNKVFDNDFDIVNLLLIVRKNLSKTYSTNKTGVQMTPFDVTYADEFTIEPCVAADGRALAASATLAVPAAATRIDLALMPASAPPAERLPGFPLIDSLAIRSALAVELRPQSQPRSMLTPSYTEFLLQLLDKDSVMTGIFVIALYVGLIQAL